MAVKKSEKKTIKQGDTVKVGYVGKFENGDVFDRSAEDQPLEFTVGEKKLIKGFEESVIGKSVGDRYTIVLQPNDAYGERQESLVQDIPLSALDGKAEAKVGSVLALRLPFGGGRMVPATIIEVGKETFKLDLNPPMAGKVLHFEINIVSIK